MPSDICYILNLPVELLVHVIKSITPTPWAGFGSLDKDYIFSHVALQATCTMFRALYMNMEGLWQEACTFHGWGRPQAPPALSCENGSWPLSDKSWRDMAILLSGHILSCPSYDCTSARGPYLPDLALSPTSALEAPAKGIKCAITGVHVAVIFPDEFCPSPVEDFTFLDGEGDSDLDRKDDSNSSGYHGRPSKTPFIEHFPQVCQLVTDPPLPAIHVGLLGLYEVKITNPTGVTMWDVVYQIAEHFAFDYYFDLASLFKLYRLHRERDQIFARGPWSDKLQKLDWIADMTVRQLLNNARRSVSGGRLHEKEKAQRYLAICEVFSQVPSVLDMSLFRFLDFAIEVLTNFLSEITLQDVIETFESNDVDSAWGDALYDMTLVSAFLGDSVFFGLKETAESDLLVTKWF